MAAETTKAKYKIVDQGAIVTANAENKRILTVEDADAEVSLHIAHVPDEDSENKRIALDTYRGDFPNPA